MGARVTADDIAGCLARSTFKDALCVVDRCTMVGDEADLLVLNPCLRVTDVEIKVSRADLKADRRKSKWRQPLSYGWSHRFEATHGRWPTPADREAACVPLAWPRGVWKHYYAMPAAIWRDDLREVCGPASGILVVHPREGSSPRGWRVEVVRRARPARDARKFGPVEVMRLARLASLRMWDAYAERRAEEEVR